MASFGKLSTGALEKWWLSRRFSMLSGTRQMHRYQCWNFDVVFLLEMGLQFVRNDLYYSNCNRTIPEQTFVPELLGSVKFESKICIIYIHCSGRKLTIMLPHTHTGNSWKLSCVLILARIYFLINFTLHWQILLFTDKFVVHKIISCVLLCSCEKIMLWDVI